MKVSGYILLVAAALSLAPLQPSPVQAQDRSCQPGERCAREDNRRRSDDRRPDDRRQEQRRSDERQQQRRSDDKRQEQHRSEPRREDGRRHDDNRRRAQQEQERQKHDRAQEQLEQRRRDAQDLQNRRREQEAAAKAAAGGNGFNAEYLRSRQEQARLREREQQRHDRIREASQRERDDHMRAEQRRRDLAYDQWYRKEMKERQRTQYRRERAYRQHYHRPVFYPSGISDWRDQRFDPRWPYPGDRVYHSTRYNGRYGALPRLPRGEEYRVKDDTILRVDSNTMRIIAVLGVLSALNAMR